MLADIRLISTKLASDWGSLFMTHLSSTLSGCLHCREEVCKKMDASSQLAILTPLPWAVDGLLDEAAVEAVLKAHQLGFYRIPDLLSSGISALWRTSVA